MRQPVAKITGRAALLARDDIDTDAIFPAQFLKKTGRSGMGVHLFADWVAAGHPEAAFVTAEHRVNILVAGRNFGCGSSREHAVWALADHGIQAIVALSFGDIFRNNCVKNGIVAATVTPQDHAALVLAVMSGSTALEMVLVVQVHGLHLVTTMTLPHRGRGELLHFVFCFPARVKKE